MFIDTAQTDELYELAIAHTVAPPLTEFDLTLPL